MRKLILIAPFIQSVSPDVIDINADSQEIEIFGSSFSPQTIFNLGENITILEIVSVEANKAVLLVNTGSQEMLNPVKAKNGSTESFGEVFLQTKDITILIPDNEGEVLWENKTSNITTGKGFIQAGNVSGWNKAATFSGVPADSDFTLELKLLASGSAYAMMGMNVLNTTSSYTDIDFAFYRSGNSLSIYENGSYGGSFGNVDDNTFYQIKRKGNQIQYLTDKQIIRTVDNATTTALIFDCCIYRNMKIHEIKLIH